MDAPYNINSQQHRLSTLFPAGAKTELAVFTFPLDGISEIHRALLERAVAHPWLFGISAALILGGVLFLTLPIIVGFAPTGPVVGSIAVAWQSWIGNVVAGSLFAVIQSLSMTGVFDTLGLALVAAGVGFGGVVGALPPGFGGGGGGERSGGSYNGVGGAVVPAAVLAAWFGLQGM